MDFDVYKMSAIEDMEYDSVCSIGCWFEADDCGSYDDDCSGDCIDWKPVSLDSNEYVHAK